MIPFKTTDKQRTRLMWVVKKMIEGGLSREMVEEAHNIAKFDQGLFDLMDMWCTDPNDRQDIWKDVQDMVSEYKKYGVKGEDDI